MDLSTIGVIIMSFLGISATALAVVTYIDQTNIMTCPSGYSSCTVYYFVNGNQVGSKKINVGDTFQAKMSGNCKAGYLNNYQCSGNYLQRQYMNSDCSTVWKNSQRCTYGCSNNQCNPRPTTTTTVRPTTTTTTTIPPIDNSRLYVWHGSSTTNSPLYIAKDNALCDFQYPYLEKSDDIRVDALWSSTGKYVYISFDAPVGVSDTHNILWEGHAEGKCGAYYCSGASLYVWNWGTNKYVLFDKYDTSTIFYPNTDYTLTASVPSTGYTNQGIVHFIVVSNYVTAMIYTDYIHIQ